MLDLRSQLEAIRGDDVQKEIEAELANLAQLKKQTQEHADELYREEQSMKLEKVRWQREMGDARDKLADAKANILKQGNKIRGLEWGYSLKPNPKESALRLEIGELREQLETVQAENEALKASQSEAEFEPLEAAELLNQLKAVRRKSTVSLADIEALLEMMGK